MSGLTVDTGAAIGTDNVVAHVEDYTPGSVTAVVAGVSTAQLWASARRPDRHVFLRAVDEHVIAFADDPEPVADPVIAIGPEYLARALDALPEQPSLTVAFDNHGDALVLDAGDDGAVAVAGRIVPAWHDGETVRVGGGVWS